MWPFENYVNYAGSKTWETSSKSNHMFENYVNYAGSKTTLPLLYQNYRLRTM